MNRWRAAGHGLLPSSLSLLFPPLLLEDQPLSFVRPGLDLGQDVPQLVLD
jgi:hypothetical protein